jgi:hypothetical protein
MLCHDLRRSATSRRQGTILVGESGIVPAGLRVAQEIEPFHLTGEWRERTGNEACLPLIAHGSGEPTEPAPCSSAQRVALTTIAAKTRASPRHQPAEWLDGTAARPEGPAAVEAISWDESGRERGRFRSPFGALCLAIRLANQSTSHTHRRKSFEFGGTPNPDRSG